MGRVPPSEKKRYSDKLHELRNRLQKERIDYFRIEYRDICGKEVHTDETDKERLLGNHSKLKGQGDMINGIKGNAIRTAGLLREANVE